MYKTIFFLQIVFLFFCVWGCKGKQNVLSWFLLQQLWDELKVLNSGARLVLPRVSVLGFHCRWSVADALLLQIHPSHPPSPHPPLEMLVKLVSSVLATGFGEMAGKLIWKSCWKSVAYPACHRPEDQVFWRKARSTLVRPPEPCNWELGFLGLAII